MNRNLNRRIHPIAEADGLSPKKPRKRGCRCELCGSEKNINVHHTFYDPKCYAWDYDIRDVRVLCGKCHEKHHKMSSLFND